MMKMNRKSLLLITSVLLLVVGAGMIAYAAFYVYSPVTGPVTINYAAAVNTSGYPTILVTVTNNGVAVSGATVYLYYNYTNVGYPAPAWNGGVGWTLWGSGTSDGSGHVTFTFSPPYNGYDYYFEAYYYVS